MFSMGPAKSVPKTMVRPCLSIVITIDPTQAISTRDCVVCLFRAAVMVPLANPEATRAAYYSDRRVITRRTAQKRDVPCPASSEINKSLHSVITAPAPGLFPHSSPFNRSGHLLSFMVRGALKFHLNSNLTGIKWRCLVSFMVPVFK